MHLLPSFYSFASYLYFRNQKLAIANHLTSTVVIQANEIRRHEGRIQLNRIGLCLGKNHQQYERYGSNVFHRAVWGWLFPHSVSITTSVNQFREISNQTVFIAMTDYINISY